MDQLAKESSMNSISISGNLGKDAETRFLPNGDPVCNFSVADSQGKDKQSIWWNCALFGKRAESLAPYLTKGQTVTVIGSVTEREWTDKDGGKRKQFDVRVSDLALQGGRRDEQPRTQTRPATRSAPPLSTPNDFQDSDIPF
jgi:single-strand DNA-binding protein